MTSEAPCNSTSIDDCEVKPSATCDLRRNVSIIILKKNITDVRYTALLSWATLLLLQGC